MRVIQVLEIGFMWILSIQAMDYPINELDKKYPQIGTEKLQN